MRHSISALYLYFNRVLTQGHSRTVKAKKNILASFLIKGGSIAISLLLVPLTISYINDVRYGIWLTLSSIVAWFSFFDIGFGHGLRNRFSESVAKGDFNLARKYVSTTYAILIMIIAGVLLLFLFINPFLKWTSILDAPIEMADELRILALVVFVFFCLQFVLKLITTVLTANQEPAKASFWTLLGSLFSLAIIYILTKTTEGSLVYLGTALSFTPVLVLTCSSFWFYRNSYRKYAPSIKFIDFSLSKDLMSLGWKFFIIQIGVLILLSTNNVIITQLFGPAKVTPYNIAYKLFSVITMGFGIIAAPLWSAYTEAYVKGEMDWIRNILSRMRKIWFLSILLVAIVFFYSPFLYDIWIGDKVVISVELSLAMSTFVVAYLWHTIYVFFLNGIGKIKLQLYLVIGSALINIPLAIYLGGHFGLVGITLTGTVLYTIMGIIYYIQTRKLLRGTATGIWNQ